MEELSNQAVALVKGIWKYRWWAALASWVVFAAGVLFVFLLPDKYQASARVYVDTQSMLKPLMSNMTSIPNMEQQVSTMSRTLLSRPNVERLIRMVDLDIKAKNSKEQEQLIHELMRDIKLVGTAREDIYTITYEHSNARLAKDVVQSLLTIFVEGSFGDKKQDSQKAVAFIDEQISVYEQKLVEAENALKQFKQKNAGTLPREGGSHAAKLAQIADMLDQAQLELRAAEESRNALRKQLAGEEPVLITDQQVIVATDPELDARLNGLYKNLDALQLQFTERHPDIVSAKRLIAELEARKEAQAKQRSESAATRPSYAPMLQQMRATLAEAEASTAAMSARVAEYAARYAKLKAMMDAVPEVETQLAQLNRDYTINKDNYEKLISRREAAKLSEELASAGMIRFKIIDPPVVPQKPTGPNRLRLLTMVLAAALGAGVGLGLVLNQVRPTFLTQASLRQFTDIPLLGTVSTIQSQAQRAKERRNMLNLSLVFLALALAYAAAAFKVL